MATTGALRHSASVKFRPEAAREGDLPSLRGLPEHRQLSRMQSIREGGAKRREHEVLPAERKMQDVFWAVYFLLVAGSILIVGLIDGGQMAFNSQPIPGGVSEFIGVCFWTILKSIVVGCCASLATTLGFIVLARFFPLQVVYFCLYSSPCSMAVLGLVFLKSAPENSTLGLGLLGFSLLSFLVVHFSWRRYFAFTARLLDVVACAFLSNSSLAVAGIVGAIVPIIWGFCCFFCWDFYSAAVGQPGQKGPLRALVPLFIWGSMTIYYVSYTTYAGVFGRWYYQRDQDRAFLGAARAACVSSLGSCARGAFVVSLVQSLKLLIQEKRDERRRSGNLVVLILLCITHCIVSMIGEMFEYINEWAFVQVALRGVSFPDAVTITFSLCTTGNMQYVIGDMVLNSVVNCMGQLAAGAAAVSALLLVVGDSVFAGLDPDSDKTAVRVSLTLGLTFMCGLMTSVMCTQILTCGVKTILVGWADAPERLRHEASALNAELSEKINAGYDKDMPAGHRAELSKVE